MGILYTTVYTLGFILLSPWFLFKMWKRGKYRQNFWQRFGVYSGELRERLSRKSVPRGWIQAVSVGEVNVALLLIQSLCQKRPQIQLILTTTTSTGYALAHERLSRDGGRIELLYFPQDFPGSVRRAYQLIQPDFVILIESELWPNHIWEGRRRGAPILLVNGRMSPRSARGYRRLRWLFRSVFSPLSLVCAQSPEDADHFVALGVSRERVHVTGNMKYDGSVPPREEAGPDVRGILDGLGIAPSRPVLVAGSTHPGEEEILLDLLPVWRRSFPELFLIVAPRHVERTREIVELTRRRCVEMVLRTEAAGASGGPSKRWDGLLLNTTGELKWFYNVATVIFVGKSLTGQGGQNIVEAAASGHPVLFGPHMQNFRAIAREFVDEGAAIQVRDPGELAEGVVQLLRSAERQEQVVAAARRVIAANLGATDRSVRLALTVLAGTPAGEAGGADVGREPSAQAADPPGKNSIVKSGPIG